MKHTQTSIYLSHYCQILVVSSTPGTIGMMKHLANMKPPCNMQKSGHDNSPPFKIILSGFDPALLHLVTQARQNQHPVSIVIVDIQKCSEPDAERLIAALLGADAALQILLLAPGNPPLSARLVSFLSRCNRIAMLKMPCDDLELGQLVRVMLAKWTAERSASDAGIVPGTELGDAFATPASSSDSRMPSGGPATILTVEDDEAVCWMMNRVLETRNYRVISATNADDAWRLWCGNINTIKLVITDINMPGGPNGVALGHAIQEEDASVPVIYTSGHRAVHEFAELHAGSNYLVKPFRMDDLLGIVERALSSQESRGLAAASSRIVTWETEHEANCVSMRN